jgi:MHS family alpha-ketoglutarate permease-like MFS transporter
MPVQEEHIVNTLAATARPVPARRTGARTVAIASLGNAMEWFDWGAFVTFAALLGPQLQPGGDSATEVLRTLSVFAVGFFFRPLGAVLFGAYSDRRGRSAALRLSLLTMAGGSALIALIPPYRTAGVLAPLLLVLARALQGLSAGGESTAMSTYVNESAPRGRRGLYSSAIYISTTLGTLAATLLALLLNRTLSPAQLADWGWRVPFALGALLALYGWYLRGRMQETPVYDAVRQRPRNPARQALRSHPRAGARVIGFTLGATVVYYTFASYLPVYAQLRYGISANGALWAAVAAQVLFMAALPVLGGAADRFGRRPLLLVFGIGFACLSPLLIGVLSDSPLRLFAVMAAALLLFGCYAAAAPAAMLEMFPTEVRSSGIGLPYALTVAVFGGTAPYLNEYLATHGHASWYPWYLTALCLVSTVAFVRYRETKDVDLAAVGQGGDRARGSGPA